MDKVLVDTASASTIVKMDIVQDIGITAEKDDIRTGVGGSEFVFLKTVDSIEMNGLHIKDFTIDF